MTYSFVDPSSELPDIQKEIKNEVSVPVVETFSIEQLESQKASYQAQIDVIQAKIDAAKADLSIA